jgi:hypothetical protein
MEQPRQYTAQVVRQFTKAKKFRVVLIPAKKLSYSCQNPEDYLQQIFVLPDKNRTLLLVIEAPYFLYHNRSHSSAILVVHVNVILPHRNETPSALPAYVSPFSDFRVFSPLMDVPSRQDSPYYMFACHGVSAVLLPMTCFFYLFLTVAAAPPILSWGCGAGLLPQL